MQVSNFRPWGPTPWLFKKINMPKWSLLGCISTEERSVSSINNLSENVMFNTLIRIRDSDPIDLNEELNQLDKSEGCLIQNTSKTYNVYEDHLKASLDDIENYIELAIRDSPNLIVDITSFPKRWFFPLIQMCSCDKRVKNLIVNYTVGENYAHTISENPEFIRAIPGFSGIEGREHHDYVFVGVGFHSLSMLSLFGDETAHNIHMLFPFPPGPPGIKKNWQFVEQVERLIKTDTSDEEAKSIIDYTQLSALDVSQTFDAISAVTLNGTKTSMIAPYGPKPLSLAMCLFSIASEIGELPEVPAFYSQPQRYALHYTGKASKKSGKVKSSAYCLKIDGNFLYTL